VVWVVTFQRKEGTLHKCLVSPEDAFFREIGLDKPTYREISGKTDYTALPW